jgi:hypothetical protein
MILMHVMKMPIVKIVHMTLMADCGVAAVRAVLVGVVSVMLLVAGHDRLAYLVPNLDLSSFFSAEALAAPLSQLRLRGQQYAI